MLINTAHVSVDYTYGCGRTSEGQAEQHQQRDELISRLYVRHGQVTVTAAETHHRRRQHICQLQEIQGHQGGEDDGELDKHTHTHTSDTRAKQRVSSIKYCPESE